MTIPEQVTRIIADSGNSFHARVAQWFVANNWQVRVSPYYLDHIQGKAREIDLVVEKAFKITNPYGDYYGELAVRLFVECKFLPGHSVFWCADKDKTAAMNLVCTQGGGFRQNNSYTARHHYLAEAPRVAKVFASSKGSVEQDPFFKALNQVLSAQVAMRNQLPFVLVENQHRMRTHGVLNYPVIICNSFSGVYSVDFYGNDPPAHIDHNLQLEVQYAYPDKDGSARNDYFLIDIVELDQLSTFVDALTVDANTAIHFLQPQ
jgi:hypothetical protein